MLMFLLGVLVGYILLSYLHEALWGQRWMDFIQLPYLISRTIFEGILYVILFPFILLWRLFRNVFKPVKSEAIQNLNLWKDSVHVLGTIYLCHDKKAKRILNKWFFYRVIPSEKIKTGA